VAGIAFLRWQYGVERLRSDAVTEPQRATRRPSESVQRVSEPHRLYAARHQRFGWWSLFVFATLGLVLEFLHGFKIQAYLSVSNETRRLMWTLAHAHGVLLGIINIVLGSTLDRGGLAIDNVPWISPALIAASLLLPAGFFAAGMTFYEGDPGVGIALVPIGAASLLFALGMIARGTGQPD